MLKAPTAWPTTALSILKLNSASHHIQAFT